MCSEYLGPPSHSVLKAVVTGGNRLTKAGALNVEPIPGCGLTCSLWVSSFFLLFRLFVCLFCFILFFEPGFLMFSLPSSFYSGTGSVD